jgi:hypothetical protein
MVKIRIIIMIDDFVYVSIVLTGGAGGAQWTVVSVVGATPSRIRLAQLITLGERRWRRARCGSFTRVGAHCHGGLFLMGGRRSHVWQKIARNAHARTKRSSHHVTLSNSVFVVSLLSAPPRLASGTYIHNGCGVGVEGEGGREAWGKGPERFWA